MAISSHFARTYIPVRLCQLIVSLSIMRHKLKSGKMCRKLTDAVLFVPALMLGWAFSLFLFILAFLLVLVFLLVLGFLHKSNVRAVNIGEVETKPSKASSRV